MHVHDPGLVSISVGVFSAAAGRPLPIGPSAIAAETPVVWVGQSPADDESQVVLESLAGGKPRAYVAVIEEVSERLFRRDLARLGAPADIGFFRPFYRAHARDLLQRLDGLQIRIGGTGAP
jgi:hypothetical protein